MDIERLDVDNIIEVKLIRRVLKDKPKLLTIFEMLCVVASQKLNSEGERIKKDPPIEEEEDITNLLESDTDDDDSNSDSPTS
jgi:hypothetical protein